MEGIHDGHFGELQRVLKAKSAVYWPGCDDQIRNMVDSCVTCQRIAIEIRQSRFAQYRYHSTHSSECQETYSRSKASTTFSSLIPTVNGRLVRPSAR